MQIPLSCNILRMVVWVLPFLCLCGFQKGIHAQSIRPLDPQMNACAANEELLSVTTDSGPFLQFDLPLQVELWTRTNGTEADRYFGQQQDWLVGGAQAELRICVPREACIQVLLLASLPAATDIDSSTSDYAIFEEIMVVHETEGVLNLNGQSNGKKGARFFVETGTCSAQALSSCSDDEFLLVLEFNTDTQYSDFQWKFVNTYSDETLVSCGGGPDEECYNGGGNTDSPIGFRIARHCLPRSECFQLVTGRSYATGQDIEYLDIYADGVLIQREEDLEFLALDIVLSSSMCVLEDVACSYDESLLELIVQRFPSIPGLPDLSWSIETSEKLELSGFAPQEDSGIVSLEPNNEGLLYFRKCVPRHSCSTLNLDIELDELDYIDEYVRYQMSIDGVQYGKNDYYFRGDQLHMTAHAGESCDFDDVCDPSYESLLAFEVTAVYAEAQTDIGVIWRVFNADVEEELEMEHYKPGTTTRQFICFSPFYWGCSFFGIQGTDDRFDQIEDFRVWINGVELYNPEMCDFNDGGDYCSGYKGHSLTASSCVNNDGSASPWVDEESEFLSSGAALGLFVFAMAIVVVAMIVLYRRSQNLRRNSTGDATGGTATPSGTTPSRDEVVAVLVPIGKSATDSGARLDATNSESGEDHSSFQKGSEGGDEDSHC